MPLYEVAILEEPTQKQVDECGAQERLVFGPKAVVAQNKESAGVIAVAGEELEGDRTRMKVLVRPFV